MEPRPPEVLQHLLALLRLGEGTVDELIVEALEILVEELDIETAFVSLFQEGERRITHAAGLPPPDGAGAPVPREESICHLVVTGQVDPLVPDSGADSVLRAHPHVIEYGIGTYVGVPLVVDRRTVGAVCGVASGPRPNLDERDVARLTTVSTYVGELLQPTAVPRSTTSPTAATAAGTAIPRPRTGDPAAVNLPQVAAAVAEADNLESLTRPLLELLHQTTGLESTYLTVIDWAGNEQHVVHSLNTGELEMPEGLAVEWSDTLCRRSLDEGTPYTPDVPAVWGDSEAARRLGIQTYVSVPITDDDEAVIGTLCGASSRRTVLGEAHLQSMRLLARVLADQFRREQARGRERARAHELEQRTRQLHDEASHDPLTGLLNRGGIQTWLASVLPALTPADQLALAFIDVDTFKSVNDTDGHAAGDEVLRRLAASLCTVGRTGDLHGRLGGDEFVVAAVLPATEASLGNWSGRLRRAALVEVGGRTVRATVGVAAITDPTTTPEDALGRADAAMYELKPRHPRS